MKLKRLLVPVACLLAVTCPAEENILRLATTTSTYETGLLDSILPPFEQANNVKVHVISVGTGKAIRIAEDGEVDVILVHARDAEDKFIEEGYGVNRKDVMHNDFLILGPEADPAGVTGMKDAKGALKKIADGGHIFVSRGDESGTHKMEQSLWAKAEVKPGGSWYLESGQGMSAAVRIADEKNGYVLIDRATYLSLKDSLRLKIAVEGDKVLSNPYGIIAVNPEKHRHVKYDLAMVLIQWITSPECQKMIAGFKKNDAQLFYPDAVPTPGN